MIKVDGSLCRSGNTGVVSTVCHNHNGLYIGSSVVVFLRAIDSAYLEAMACREARALAVDLLRDDIIIPCDCKQVVQDIKTDSEGRHSPTI
jgi:hypothetical protein